VNAYLNQLCLLTLLPWLQAEDAQAKALTQRRRDR